MTPSLKAERFEDGYRSLDRGAWQAPIVPRVAVEVALSGRVKITVRIVCVVAGAGFEPATQGL